MNAPLWLILAVSAGTDFLISAGGVLTGAMVANGQIGMPTKAVWLFAAIVGLVAVGKELRSQLKLPPLDIPPAVKIASVALAGLAMLALPALVEASGCQWNSASGPIGGGYPLGKVTATLGTTTAVAFTLPTTTTDSKTVKAVNGVFVTVTSGSINTYDDGSTPTTSTTAGGQPFGACAGCSIQFWVCGPKAISNFLMIGQSGSPTVVYSLYGSAQ